MSRWGTLVVLLGALLAQGCFLFGKDDKGVKPAELVDFEPRLKIRKDWSVGIGGGVKVAGTRLDPAYASGRIYASASGGTVKAVAVETGAAVWTTRLKLTLSSGPGVDEGLVVVGALDGAVVALDAETGAERWRAGVSSEVLARPLVHRGVVVVRAQDGRVFGLSAEDGRRQWVFDRSVPLLTLRGNSPPVGRAGYAYIGFDNGQIWALRVSDGSPVWDRVIGAPEGRNVLERMVDIDGQMAIIASDLYAVSYRGRVAALTADAGNILWVHQATSFSGVTASRAQLNLTDVDDAVWALDRLSGGTLWKQSSLARRSVSAPARHGDSVVVADFDGYLHWLSDDDGSFQARVRADSNGIGGALLVVGERLIVLGRSGRLSAYRIVSGAGD